MTRSAVRALLAASVLAGCAGLGEEGRVRAAVNDLYDGLAERDAGRVCDSLTPARRRQLAGRTRSCPATMRIAMSLIGAKLRQLGDAEVEGVDVNGSRATATVRAGGRSSRIRLAKEGGDWKVAGFGLDQL